jgi:hypothetical protein
MKPWLSAAVMTLLAVFMIVVLGPGIVVDWRHRGDVTAVDAEVVDGHCSTKLVVTWCRATLRHGDVTRKQRMLFADVHFGDYEVDVVQSADGAFLSTSIAMEHLVNRSVTLAVFAALFLGMAAAAAMKGLR